MSKKLSYVIISCLSVLIILGIVLLCMILHGIGKLGKDVVLVQDGVTRKELTVSIDGLYPTKNVSYDLRFSSGVAKTYDLTISFHDGGQTALAEYLEVSIGLNNETVSGAGLDEFLAGKRFSIDLEMEKDKPAVLSFDYTMARDAGNEAQNLSADFYIVVEVNG